MSPLPTTYNVSVTEYHGGYVFSVESDGTISITDSATTLNVALLDINDFMHFLLDYYDWCFIAYDDTRTANTELSELWIEYLKYYQKTIDRYYSDMTEYYNPTYNYDRSECHYYNVSDDFNKYGSETNSVTPSGTKTTTVVYGESFSNDMQYGKIHGDTSVTVSDGNVTTSTGVNAGTAFATYNFINSYDDSTGTLPANKTDSSQNDGTSANSGTTNSATVTNETYSNDYSTDTTLSFTDRNDNNKKSGQDGLRMYGNIGVTSTTALIREDIDFRMKYNLVEFIYKKFIDKYCFLSPMDGD